MNKTGLLATLALTTAGCLGACVAARANGSGLHTGPSAVAFRLDSDGLQGCKEVGLVAETDGAIDLPENCSCDHPALAKGTELGAIRRLSDSAAALGANAVWVLKIVEASESITHSWDCCRVSGFRSYGVAFVCEPDMLEWHEKHEAGKGADN